MRRYLQGTLDYACGIYAVINAFSHVFGLNLAGARRLFAQSQIELAARPRLWAHYVRNETDHYWLVRYLLLRWCSTGGALPDAGFAVYCPFENPPCQNDGELDRARLHLPERQPPDGPPSAFEAASESLAVWQALSDWFRPKNTASRAAVLRFHRFVPQIPHPIVSHWTCATAADAKALRLFDASAEDNALHSLERTSLLPGQGRRALLRIVPESVFLLEGMRHKPLPPLPFPKT